jgi:hypothetical protein
MLMKGTHTKSTADNRKATDSLEIPPLTKEFFKTAVMGKYPSVQRRDPAIVRISPDLVKEFPSEDRVNDALRELLRIRESLVSLTSVKPKRRKSA